MPETMDPPSVTDAVTDVTPPRQSPRAKAFSPEIKALAKSLYIQGLRPSAIQQETSVTPATLRQWAKRDKWGQLRQTTRTVIVTRGQKTVVNAVATATSEQSSRVRNVLGAVVERQAQALAASQPSLNDLLNTPARQGHAAALKTLADAAATVFDWGSQHSPGIIVIGDVEKAIEQSESPINIESDVSQLSDPPDTTSNGVP